MSRPSTLALLAAVLCVSACAEPWPVRAGPWRAAGVNGLVLDVPPPPGAPDTAALALELRAKGFPPRALRCPAEGRCALRVAELDAEPRALELCVAGGGPCTRLDGQALPLAAPGAPFATQDARGLTVRWTPSEGATGYRVRLFDGDTGDERSGEAPELPAEAREALLALGPDAPENPSVEVEALRREDGVLTAVSAALGTRVSDDVRAPSGWQLFEARSERVLSLEPSAPAPDERLAVVLLNYGGPEALAVGFGGAAPVAASGLATSRSALALADPRRALESTAIAERTLATAPVEGARDAFCVLEDLDPKRPTRRPARLAAVTPHLLVYVDAADAGQYPAGYLDRLGETLEANVWPPLTTAFGEPSDLDRSGRVSLFFTSALGDQHGGYFNPRDLTAEADRSSDCGRTASNGGEVIYLASLSSSAPTPDAMLGQYYPSSIAHELFHLLHFARRCLDRRCREPEQEWISEGLAKTAEDLAGYGWNLAGWRSTAGQFLGGEYARRSLTVWEGDPAGNYEQAHSFFRFYADRRGPGFLGAVVASAEAGPGHVERALGMPLSRAAAEWATALLVSNEQDTPSARFDYRGEGWSPLHERLGPLAYEPLAETFATTLRADGFRVLVSAAGAAPARLELAVESGPLPTVVVARLRPSR